MMILSQSQFTGSCATGLSCVNGACSSASPNCNAEAGDVCEDSTYGIIKTCCSPYTCESVTSRTKTCQGLSLPANETCFEGGAVSVGPALSPVLTVSHCSLWVPAPPV